MKNEFYFFSLLCIIFIFSVVSCSNKSHLEYALEKAGDNRIELEEVLSHYQDDSLKLRAAIFLIENMPGHYSYKDSAYINKYYDAIDSIADLYPTVSFEERHTLFRQIINKYDMYQETINDIEYISSEYLIHNIDNAFRVWEENEWANHVIFDDFCEYLLPYKAAENQTLDNWREYFENYCDASIHDLQYCSLYRNSPCQACEVANMALRDSVSPIISSETVIPVRKLSTLTNVSFASCNDYCVLAASLLRAKGLPVAIDYTPQWPIRSSGHTWNILLENSGMNTPFEGAGSYMGHPHIKEHKMAKVFRKTYAINREVKELNNEEQFVPEVFQNLFFKDVTHEYMKPQDIELKIKITSNTNYAYLAVFDNADWVPIQYGKIKGKKVEFEKMGRDIAYLPVICTVNGIQGFSNPIILTVDGQIRILSPDTINKQTLKLYRKYPVMKSLFEVSNRMIGGKFQVANNPQFLNPVTLHTVEELGINSKEIRLDRIINKYRYWRYLSPNGSHGNIAELAFYEKDSINPVVGKIIGTNGSYRDGGSFYKEAAFDGDILTFFDSPHTDGSWVGMDFGRPVNINRIIYTPRSDGNCIEIGDEYELLYWGNNTWQTLGKKVATDLQLVYNNCPTNALFLLRNLTKGSEERIFTYENNKQIWW
ncbi:MAG: discoidin domain-containing protein [Prevotella sp.]|jgi:hypothetical protein|nr:discoidin domain-containing protein [Prevotella sp.]